MHFIAIIEQSCRIEIAIAALEKTGIGREAIVVTPLRDEAIHGGDLYTPGQLNLLSPYDKMFIFGALVSTIGVVYGFVLPWGPIIWGLLGALVGMAIGYGVDRLLLRGRKVQKNKAAKVAVLVRCQASQVKDIESILLGNGATEIGEIK